MFEIKEKKNSIKFSFSMVRDCIDSPLSAYSESQARERRGWRILVVEF